jgi:hypothetical protein
VKATAVGGGKPTANANNKFLDVGHFALETPVGEDAFEMKSFLAANGV